ncbi:MAG: ATP-dependent DNA ligase [Chloroflexota bacterium]|nr:ATP-dependent DNA ligase [Chloroflexota bacterium]MDE2930264.1 ATP-dependent DNA ligase [Chloroflexota bacterium]
MSSSANGCEPTEQLSALYFHQLTAYFAELDATRSRIQMMELLADLFTKTRPEEMDEVIYLLQGRVAPLYAPIEFGVGEQLTAEVVAEGTGAALDDVHRRFSEIGDYGAVAEELIEREQGSVTVAHVFERLTEIALTEGEGSVAKKVSLLADLVRNVGKQEVRYLLRIPLGRLRLGVGDPTFMDALSFARTGSKEHRPAIERAYSICSDLATVAKDYWRAGIDGLQDIHIVVGTPVIPAASERVKTMEDLVLRLGRCAVEPKFDGIRCQVHFDGENVTMYSRHLENFSGMFPDVVAAVREQAAGHTFIADSEALAYDVETGAFLPFQMTTQRRRKHNVDEMAEKLPLRLVLFDLLYLDGVDLTRQPYTERREHMLGFLREGSVLQVTENIETDSVAAIEAFFADKIEHGLEGVMAKKLDSVYQAGRRSFDWIKMKRSYQGELSDTVDCVVLGYWYGKGARSQLGIGALLLGVYDKDRDQFVTISRLGTGYSEEEWVKIRELLDKDRAEEAPSRVEAEIAPDVWSNPTHVVEIQADEITRSPTHTCGKQNGDDMGYALRFPRVVGFVREDRSPEDATSVQEVIRLYTVQAEKGKK